MRKSLRIAPGVRLNFSKSGIGYSVGPRGYRVTHRADGRVQRTVSLPGTGLSHVTTTGSARSSSGSRRSSGGSWRPAAPAPLPARPAAPGFFAPKGEKELFRAVQAGDADAADRVGQEHPDLAVAAATVAGVLDLVHGNEGRAGQLLGWVFSTGRDPGHDPFVQNYVTLRFALLVAPGVTAELGLDRSGVGLALAEVRQREGDVAGAIDVVEQVEPTTYAALSLAELYVQAGRYPDVVALTDGVTNTDDATALLCVFRGVALREQGHHDAARAAFREALRSRKRDATVRHRAWFERAQCYRAEGKKSLARKDLERILAEDSTFPGLDAALADLGS